MYVDIELLREMSTRCFESSEIINESLVRACAMQDMVENSMWGESEDIQLILKKLTETRESVLTYYALLKELGNKLQEIYDSLEPEWPMLPGPDLPMYF